SATVESLAAWTERRRAREPKVLALSSDVREVIAAGAGDEAWRGGLIAVSIRIQRHRDRSALARDARWPLLGIAEMLHERRTSVRSPRGWIQAETDSVGGRTAFFTLY